MADDNPYAPPKTDCQAKAGKRSALRLRCGMALAAASLLVVLLCPYALIDVVVGGFVGTTVAQLLTSSRIVGQIVCGFAGGTIALAISLLTTAVNFGGMPVVFSEPSIWAAALLMGAAPGIALAMLLNRFVWKRASNSRI